MTRFALQFGQTQSGLTYVERMTAYGICARGEAQIAIAQIGKSGGFEYDLPGGGIEADEEEAGALMREFQEETGLTVWPTRVIGRAGQYWVNKGEPRNSLSTFYEVELSAADGAAAGGRLHGRIVRGRALGGPDELSRTDPDGSRTRPRGAADGRRLNHTPRRLRCQCMIAQAWAS